MLSRHIDALRDSIFGRYARVWFEQANIKAHPSKSGDIIANDCGPSNDGLEMWEDGLNGLLRVDSCSRR
ncbi:hypothetical protein N7507_002770 [Penicillium longicatenatum]|nr:hypothetical protein N7507_002770 [Penicillium longicatenatum]